MGGGQPQAATWSTHKKSYVLPFFRDSPAWLLLQVGAIHQLGGAAGATGSRCSGGSESGPPRLGPGGQESVLLR